MAWFRRKDPDSMDPQYLLAQAQAAEPVPPAQPTPGAPVASAVPTSGFRMPIEDVFVITGRGTVVTGRVEAGVIAKGSTVRLARADGSVRDVEVTGIEMFRKISDSAKAGDNVGLLLRGVGRDDVGRGDVLSA
jgi:translation elongation factor EF-Tu-like GTPase